MINESGFTLRVRDPSLLDFERLQLVNVTLVARETAAAAANSPRESRAQVTVHVLDRNDNSPEFERSRYEVVVSEAATAGATLAWVAATDADSGQLGTAGIRYTRIAGPLADRLLLDRNTGEFYYYFSFPPKI